MDRDAASRAPRAHDRRARAGPARALRRRRGDAHGDQRQVHARAAGRRSGGSGPRARALAHRPRRAVRADALALRGRLALEPDPQPAASASGRPGGPLVREVLEAIALCLVEGDVAALLEVVEHVAPSQRGETNADRGALPGSQLLGDFGEATLT